MKTILITGINGFLGSQLARKFAGKHNVIGLEYSLDNLWRIKGLGLEVYSSQESLEQIFINNDIYAVIHTATFYGRNQESMRMMAESNMIFPFNLLDTAIKCDTPVFINTDTALDRFVSAYALTKNQFKDWLYFRRNEIKTVNLQLEHFFGPGVSNTNFVMAMIEKLRRNETIDLTAGEQRRDFIYYEDVVDAFSTVVEMVNRIETFSNFQVGSGDMITIKELMLFMKEQLSSGSVLNFGAIPYRENELMVSEVDLEPLNKLGWNPKFTIKEGLKKQLKTEN